MEIVQYNIRITNEALTDLRQIAHHVREGSPQNAPLVAAMILDAVHSLDRMPHRFRRAGQTRKRGSAVHAMVVAPFIVYYRIDEAQKAVRILAVVHGARRQPRRFD